jgi:GH24 family phage-related lysozyme (muramidase)
MPFTPEGWTLLKTWEGCRLSTYPDPASGGAPWTIGYGHTGAEVVPGLTISREQAEAWLKQDVAVAAGAVDRLLSGVGMTARQRDAVISFCFNVGVGALERSTLRKGLIAGELLADVIALELPRWQKAPMAQWKGSSAARRQRCLMHKRQNARMLLRTNRIDCIMPPGRIARGFSRFRVPGR